MAASSSASVSRKRARTAILGDEGDDSADEDDRPPVTLRGGPAMPEDFVKQYSEGNFIDTEIEVEGRTFPAQKAVLSAGSEYFNGLLAGGGAHMARSETLTLDEMSSTTFECVLAWLYTGTCPVSRGSLLDLLAAAGRLRIETLIVDATWAIVGHLLDESTCFEIWEMASQLMVPRLEKEAERYALEYFDAVAQSGALANLNAERLARLLGSDRLCCSTEEVALDALLEWARIHTPTPEELAELLNKIRFKEFTIDSTASRMAAEPLLDSLPCMKVIAEKLAALSQHDPIGPRTTARVEYVSPGFSDEFDTEFQRARMAKMREVGRDARDAAVYAKKIEDAADDAPRQQIMGPLYMFVVCKYPSFRPAFELALRLRLMNTFFFVGTADEFGTTVPALGGRAASIKIFRNSSNERTQRLHPRPSIREFRRFLPNDTAQLAWADDLLHIDENFFPYRPYPISDDVAKIRILNGIADGIMQRNLRLTLFCTEELPPEAMFAMDKFCPLLQGIFTPRASWEPPRLRRPSTFASTV